MKPSSFLIPLFPKAQRPSSPSSRRSVFPAALRAARYAAVTPPNRATASSLNTARPAYHLW